MCSTLHLWIVSFQQSTRPPWSAFKLPGEHCRAPTQELLRPQQLTSGTGGWDLRPMASLMRSVRGGRLSCTAQGSLFRLHDHLLSTYRLHDAKQVQKALTRMWHSRQEEKSVQTRTILSR